MNKIVNAVKKVVAPKKVAVKKEEATKSDVCSNCDNSGKECNVCLRGKDVV